MQKHHTSERYHWTFSSFEKHERTLWWYVAAGLVVGVLLIYSLLSGNFLFSLLVLVTTLVLFLRHAVEPQTIDCEITTDGIRVGSKIYLFEAIRFFWILEHEPGRDILYIEERKGLRSILPIPLHKHDPSELRLFLRKFVEEERERIYEPLWESIARMLKL